MLLISSSSRGYSSKNSLRITINEMRQYKDDFQLRLFNILPIDFRFILMQSFIILYYVSLLAQTGKKITGY